MGAQQSYVDKTSQRINILYKICGSVHKVLRIYEYEAQTIPL